MHFKITSCHYFPTYSPFQLNNLPYHFTNFTLLICKICLPGYVVRLSQHSEVRHRRRSACVRRDESYSVPCPDCKENNQNFHISIDSQVFKLFEHREHEHCDDDENDELNC